MEEAAANAAVEEHRRNKTQLDLQDRYKLDLEREKMVESASHSSARLCRSLGLIRRHVVLSNVQNENE